AFQWVVDNKPVLIGILTAIGVAFAGWAVSAAAAAASTIAAMAPFIAVGAAIAGVVAAVVYAYQEWDWFRSTVNAVRDFLVNKLWPALKAVASFIVDSLVPAVV